MHTYLRVMQKLSIGFLFSVAATLSTAVIAAERPYADHPHMWGMMWGLGGMFFSAVMMIVFIAVAVGVIVLVIRWLGGGRIGRSPADKTPLDILKERFAQGDINKEEFEERKRLLLE